jgi:hypothetical protein
LTKIYLANMTEPGTAAEAGRAAGRGRLARQMFAVVSDDVLPAREAGRSGSTVWPVLSLPLAYALEVAADSEGAVRDRVVLLVRGYWLYRQLGNHDGLERCRASLNTVKARGGRVAGAVRDVYDRVEVGGELAEEAS